MVVPEKRVYWLGELKHALYIMATWDSYVNLPKWPQPCSQEFVLTGYFVSAGAGKTKLV